MGAIAQVQGNVDHHDQPSQAWTSEGSIKRAVVSLVMALQVDYASQFSSAYGSDDQLRGFKNRLLEGFRSCGAVAADVVNGYEAFISVPENVRFMPTLPQLVNSVSSARVDRLAAERSAEEAVKLAELPPPRRGYDPMAMLAQVKSASSGVVDFETLRQQHDALLASHYARGLIKRVEVSVKDKCAVAGCQSVGRLSSSTHGGGNMYCSRHFRMTV